MYPELLQHASLFALLGRIDEDLSQKVKELDCPQCGGRLHRAWFLRKPRGAAIVLPESLSWRRGLCCGICRRRVLPPSVLFFGRKVYWAAVIVLVAGLRQRGATCASARRLQELYGVSRLTVQRWVTWFAEAFVQSPAWRQLRGYIGHLLGDSTVPACVLEAFGLVRQGSSMEAMVSASHTLAQLWGRVQLVHDG